MRVHPRVLRLPRLGSRPARAPHESGDYTIPDGLDARLSPPIDDVFVPTDFDDGETTTITRHRVR